MGEMSMVGGSTGKAIQLTLRENCPYSEFFSSECGKIWTRKTSNTDTFHAVLPFQTQ